MRIQRSGPFGQRGAALAVFGLFVACGLVFIFAGTLARANELEARAAVEREARDELQRQVDAGIAEMEFIETDAFLEQQARAEGFGTPGELLFGLPADAPSPPPIVPLGAERAREVIRPPFDAWMELLFGS